MKSEKQSKKQEEQYMLKCNFCTQSSPGGKCFWHSETARQKDCEKAIANMVNALCK